MRFRGKHPIFSNRNIKTRARLLQRSLKVRNSFCVVMALSDLYQELAMAKKLRGCPCTEVIDFQSLFQMYLAYGLSYVIKGEYHAR